MPQAGIRAHSGTVQRLVGPVDLARFDSTVKVPTEGSGRTSRHPGRRVPVRSLCDGPGVHSAGSARIALGRRAAIIGESASAIDPAFEDAHRCVGRPALSGAEHRDYRRAVSDCGCVDSNERPRMRSNRDGGITVPK